MEQNEKSNADMEFIAKSLGEIKGKLNVIMSYTPNIPSYKIVENSLWHSFCEDGFPRPFRPVLVRGYRIVGEFAMIREGLADVVYRCVDLPLSDFKKYIKVGEAEKFNFTEWAYCDELYKAECGN